MEHIDPEELDSLALGDERPSAAQRAHLDVCADCRGDLTALRRTAGAIRSSRDLAASEAPDSVWAAVHAELELDESLAATPRRGVLPAAETAVAPEAAPADAAPSSIPLPPTRRAAARRRPSRSPARRWLVPAIAAGAALVLGVGGGFALSGLLGTGAGDVVATARLDALPDWPDASGSATLHELGDGTREVRVEVDTVSGDDDAPLREVWLLTPDATGLVSIGFLDGPSGTFRIPADVDLSAYPVVDVSAEPQDGDPAHSGDSIVRGELGAS